jgi:hypothetical protein
MQKQDVLDRSTPHSSAAATAPSADDVVAERLGTVMLWLIPALAFLAALLR